MLVVRKAVIKAKLGENGLEIGDLHLRSEALPAANAGCAGIFLASLLVKFDAELRGPLKDVEELPERQIEQGSDHCDGVEYREELIQRPAEPQGGGSKSESGDRDGEEKDEGKKIR